jgi:hypothetical protein
MSTSTTEYNSVDDLALGHRVINYALKLLAWGTAAAVAWSCSTLLMGIVMFIIVSIVMLLLTTIIHLAIMFKVPTTTVEGLGRTVGGFAGRMSNLFTRKAPVAA